MTVKIHDLTNNTIYIASSIDDCRDDTDKSAYELAVEFNDVIVMGLIIAEPIRWWEVSALH